MVNSNTAVNYFYNVKLNREQERAKNKEEFILEIVRYINRQWELLREQIRALFANDIRKQLVEVCIAYVRFWVANPHYRSVLMSSQMELDKTRESNSMENLIRTYCADQGADADETERTVYAVKAIIFGMTAMMENGELLNEPKTY